MSWKKYWIKLICTTLIVGLCVYSLIIIVDPYDTLKFSYPAKREPIVSNQRFSYPSIAQKDFHDSAIIGTSTIRLLNPENLNPVFDAKFVNLAMNSTTAYEQYKILKLFISSHENIKFLMVGVDLAWCDTNVEPKKLTFRPFPTWLYDKNEFNDYLNMFSARGLENSVRLIEYWLGKREAKYNGDGYHNFVGDDSRYDLQKAVTNIYGSIENKISFEEKLSNKNNKGSSSNESLQFPVHKLYLSKIFDSLNDDVIKLIVFVPYHYRHTYRQHENFNECKNKLIKFSHKYKNTHLVDFMFDSEITNNDSNYWDVQHYRIHIAEKMPDLIYKTFTNMEDIENATRYLD